MDSNPFAVDHEFGETASKIVDAVSPNPERDKGNRRGLVTFLMMTRQNELRASLSAQSGRASGF